MTEEEKRLLFQDLVARLPYTPMVNLRGKAGYDRKLVSVHRYNTRREFEIVVNSDDDEDYMPHNFEIEIVKPYLRPMTDMTEEEMLDFHENGGALTHHLKYDIDLNSLTVFAIDWLLAHHFDYRGLIDMGLALEAPKGMYKF